MALTRRVKDNRYFNFDTTIGQLKDKPYDYIIEAFKKRIEKWFIYPANIIVERDAKEGHLSFPIILIDCALIESLCQFYIGKKETEPKDYKDFLRKIIPEFSRKLKRKNIIGKNKLRDYADIFYSAFRCGLMHSAMIKPYGGIAGQENIVKYDDKEGILVVQPILLHKEIVKFFDKYIKLLSERRDKKQLAKFRKKMWIDFAIRVPIS